MVKEHPVDMSRLGERWSARTNEDRTIDINHVGVPAGAGELPYDFPGWLEVYRVMEHEALKGTLHSSALLGWRVVFGVSGRCEVEVRVDREVGAVVVAIDDEVVAEWFDDWEVE
jgi:hypothetical protein